MAVQESAAQLSMTLKVQEYPTLKVGSAGRGGGRAWPVPADRGGNKGREGGRVGPGAPGGVWGGLRDGLPGLEGLGVSSGRAPEFRGLQGSAGPRSPESEGLQSRLAQGLGVCGPASPGPGGCEAGRPAGLPGGGGAQGAGACGPGGCGGGAVHGLPGLRGLRGRAWSASGAPLRPAEPDCGPLNLKKKKKGHEVSRVSDISGGSQTGDGGWVEAGVSRERGRGA